RRLMRVIASDTPALRLNSNQEPADGWPSPLQHQPTQALPRIERALRPGRIGRILLGGDLARQRELQSEQAMGHYQRFDRVQFASMA
ncbi:hypothetical protein, partial [Xanthomonas oryzae]